MVATQAWTLTAGWNWQEVRSRKARRKTRHNEEEEQEEESNQDDEDVEASVETNNGLLQIPAPRKAEAGPPGLDPPTPKHRLVGKDVSLEDQPSILYPLRQEHPDASPHTGTELRRQAWHFQDWECNRCILMNLATSSTCIACSAPRPSRAPKASAPAVPQSPDGREPASWSWRARDLYPWVVLDNPEWKVIVENTFLTVTRWRERATRKSVSAPARLNSGRVCLETMGHTAHRGMRIVSDPGSSDPDNARREWHAAHRGHGQSPPADRPHRSNSGPAAALAGGVAASVAEAESFAEGFRPGVGVHAKQVQIFPESAGAEAAAGSFFPQPVVAPVPSGYPKVRIGCQPYNDGMMKVAPAEAAAGPPPGPAFYESKVAARPPPGLASHEVHIADEAAQGKNGCKKKVHIAEEAEIVKAEMHVKIAQEVEDELLCKAGEVPVDQERDAETQAIICEKRPIVFQSGAPRAEYTVARLSDLQINLQDEEESIPELEEELQLDIAEQERHVDFKEPIDVESIASLEGDDTKVEQPVSPAEDSTPTKKTLKNRRKRQSIKARKARQKAEEDSLGLAVQPASRETAHDEHAAVTTTRARARMAPARFANSPVRRQAWSTRRCVRAMPEVSVLSCEEDSVENARVDFAASSDTETADAEQLLVQQSAAQAVAAARRELLLRTSVLPTTSTAALVFMDRAHSSASASLTCDAVDAVVSSSGNADGAATAVLVALMRERARNS